MTHFFSSISLPRARHDCRPIVISVSMSAIFFCINWFLARGTPNWILIGRQKDTYSIVHQSLWIHAEKDNLNMCSMIMLTFAHFLPHQPDPLNLTLTYTKIDSISRTCPECTVGQRGSRIQQLLELPRQCHSVHCWDSRRDPFVTKARQKPVTFMQSN